jgi:hypothetical protein
MIQKIKIDSDNFLMKTTYGIIWKILNILDLSLDLSDFDTEKELNPKHLGITENRFFRYIEMLQNAGYIDGVKIEEYLTGEKEFDLSEITITLNGIQFLLENSTMRKMANIAEKLGLIVAENGTGFLMNKLK